MDGIGTLNINLGVGVITYFEMDDPDIPNSTLFESGVNESATLMYVFFCEKLCNEAIFGKTANLKVWESEGIRSVTAILPVGKRLEG